jgi:hypothetical protein
MDGGRVEMNEDSVAWQLAEIAKVSAWMALRSQDFAIGM